MMAGMVFFINIRDNKDNFSINQYIGKNSKEWKLQELLYKIDGEAGFKYSGEMSLDGEYGFISEEYYIKKKDKVIIFAVTMSVHN